MKFIGLVYDDHAWSNVSLILFQYKGIQRTLASNSADAIRDQERGS